MKRTLFFLRKIVLGAIFGSRLTLWAQEFSDGSTNLSLKSIAPNVFQLGAVRLDQGKKTVQFPASINMTNGLVEYFLVTGTGKLHESILKTDVAPSQIHVAMLFLGAQGISASDTNVVTERKGLTSKSTDIINGEKFFIKVCWMTDNDEKYLPAENFIFNTETKSPMSKGPWIYNGSKVINGTFIAERDGSIVSIMRDPLALANSSRPNQDNDEIWFVNTNAIPPLHTKVEVTFQLEGLQKSGKGQK